MKMRSCFLFVFVLLASNVFSQDTTSWKPHVVDNIVTLHLPDGDFEIIRPMENFTVYRAVYDSVVFLFTKIDLIETTPLAKDSADLRNKYSELLQGFINTSKSQLIDSGLFKERNYLGSYLKAKKNNDGIDYFLEYKAFFLNEDTYGVQIIYPVSQLSKLSDMRKKLLSAIKISREAKQIKGAVKKKVR
ncbi:MULTISPECIES: hypothetical protein [Niastella]|uniref:Uncharacterized protein n=1 Tax=Niastella soli TaxID=2821487 RepID=A0ABS3YXD1_9BACT|nr:hypothetical protein [Niastella soli]MBO9202576.1 hypothetical protein [Niastella soli]